MNLAQWADLITKLTALIVAVTALIRVEQAHRKINALPQPPAAVSSDAPPSSPAPPPRSP